MLFDLFKSSAQKEREFIAEMDNHPINKNICPTCDRKSYCWISFTGGDDYKLRNGCKLAEKNVKEV